MAPEPDDLRALALEECAREPIRIPGSVQPHGVLLGLDGADLRVAVASTSSAELLGRPAASLTGVPLAEVVGDDAAAVLSTAAARDPDEVNPVAVVADWGDGHRPFDAVLHRSGGLLVVELEPVAGPDPSGAVAATGFAALRGPVRRLRATSSIRTLADAVAREVRALTGFDRVMVYRFDPAWNGEVIAEHRRPDMEPYLGLLYPASDIPPQARELYRTSWIRLIADVDAPPSPLVPERNPLDGEPLDLGSSTLRSVSPFHLEYLRNMGVGASMSVSLLDGDRLWGLIACHHDTPHRPPYAVRAAAELLGQIASVLLAGRTDAGEQDDAMGVAAALAELLRHVTLSGEGLAEALAADAGSLLALTGATGAAIRLGGEVRVAGDAPPPARLGAIVDAIWRDTRAPVAVTDSLALDHPDLADVKDEASGVVGVRLSDRVDADRWILWFRPEVVRTVEWGGDPGGGTVEVGDDGAPALHPRSSFRRWTDTVRLRSVAWQRHEVDGAEALGRHITDVVRRRAAEEAETAATLQRTLLLEHLPTIPGVSIAARYLPAAHDAVGGDWYDLFLLSEQRVGITLGDVAGHGVEVAGIMAQLRHGLRAYLLREPTPAAALAGLNQLTHQLLPRDLATVVVADLVPATGRLRVASAGHLPPLVVRADGEAVFLDDERGPALGLLPDSAYRLQEATLGPGDRLVVYTDGLVERRGEPLDAGLARLARRAATPDDDLDAFADMLAGDASSDDVTLLVLRVDGGPGGRI